MAEEALGRHPAKSHVNRCLAEGRFLLSRGTIFNAPEVDMKTGDWKYRIEGYTADHERVAVIFTLKPQDFVVFITVFRR